MTQKPRANYTFTREVFSDKNVIAIVDADTGMSVTNDIENVVAAVLAEEKLQPKDVFIVYRDTEGNWDGWDAVNEQFIHLGQSSWRNAMIRWFQIIYDY
jgi:hypothetical protein